MKKYSRVIAEMHKEDTKVSKRWFEDSIMSSKDFMDHYMNYIIDIALFKINDKGRKSFRSQEYASIGIMDRNDLIQEAYLAFFNAYNDVDWNRVEDSENPQAELWAYLKKKTIFDMNIAVRSKKDGVKITQWELFQSKNAIQNRDNRNGNVQFITSLFNKLDTIFFRNQEDTALTKYENELLGYFLDVHLDEHLDMTFKGERNWKGMERDVIKSFYGLDTVKLTAKEISEEYKIGLSTLKSVIKRSLDKLRSKESKELISHFCKEYFLDTQADINNI